RPGQPEPTYQYHPMLREFLLARANDAHPKDRRRQMQKDAANAMEAAGSPEDALSLYRECHEWEEMARVIEEHAQAMLAQGRGETLRRWIEDMPPDVQAQHPWSVYWAASSQAQLAPREARLLHAKAFELFQAHGDRTGMILA